MKEEEAPLEGRQEEDSEEAACSAAGQPQEQEREVTDIIKETETTQFLFLSELCDMCKYYSCQPGKQIAAWLLQCRDTGVNDLE